ncbi:hypothetical protein HQ447_03860, partial [bacterium]|nr:hypothetical protein [bacterium]
MRRSLPILLLFVWLLAGCRRDHQEVARTLEFDAFLPIYNRHIETWLYTQQAATAKDAATVAGELATAQGEEKARLELLAESLRHDQEKWRFRLALGGFLKIGDPAE